MNERIIMIVGGIIIVIFVCILCISAFNFLREYLRVFKEVKGC